MKIIQFPHHLPMNIGGGRSHRKLRLGATVHGCLISVFAFASGESISASDGARQHRRTPPSLAVSIFPSGENARNAGMAPIWTEVTSRKVARFQNLMVRSSLADTRVRPSGEKRQFIIPALWPLRTARFFPVAASHRRTVLSQLEVAIVF